MATNLPELQQQLRQLAQLQLQHALLVEWRLDYWQNWADLPAGYQVICQQVRPGQLIMTLRTKAAGGELTLTDQAYQQRILQWLPQLPAAYWDIQWSATAQPFYQQLREIAGAQQRFIWSHHSLTVKSYLQMLTILRKMATTASAVDYLKLAVVSQSSADTLALLTATWQAHHEFPQPLITMAMGHEGQISRILGPLFGSQVSFGALTTTGSAPGQLPLSQLDQILLD
ncbi:type I 3-dehydroquinate dehydratase [Lapidilactobacillus wuchangensis]|uniref:type I 3-dehydroquinate dehydratase n=1 Tax=Lapidilactobacillus wuchangensis TaxID=2486001 RepID=UPI0013DE7297|nr:type I 3-dehydroquinate dehydratase [Lapidilactobacillus wuchangensis]